MKAIVRFYRICFILAMALLLAACDQQQVPTLPDEPADLPNWRDIPGLVRDLGVPDLSELPNVPEIADLPALNAGPDAVAFAGPTERRIQAGDRIPGTDIRLAAVTDGEAEFEISGLRSVRTLGDSLDYDGGWPDAGGIDYALRLRIYNIGSNSVRAAGVHSLVVQQIQPEPGSVTLPDSSLQIPYTTSTGTGETLKGLTYGYAGSADRGAELSGLPADEFPYRKIGDSLRWEGELRPDLPIRYDLRVLFYNEDSLQVGGVATIQLPSQ